MEALFCSVQREGDTEHFGSQVLIFFLTVNFIIHSVGRQSSCQKDAENKDTLFTRLEVQGPV